ncbi:MAG: S-methyl-5-thioribose-1-phosphate isomerase [Casimicrobiaceae bacterium]|nr:S-methyl-5-thioribose-1-phosphate isomerase [Casimicrobiaceae bacterium]
MTCPAHARSIEPLADGAGIRVLDQTRLPHDKRWLTLSDPAAVEVAIQTMQVRGAPLIGACGAFGLALALRHQADDAALAYWSERLASARPTAINLRWAVERVRQVAAQAAPERRFSKGWAEAMRIAEEDVAINEAIARQGLTLLKQRAAECGAGTPARPLRLMTHCNAGALATVAWGTALAPIYLAHEQGMAVQVWVSETRPRNQGALTAFELAQRGVPCTMIADNAAGVLMMEGKVDAVILGCDRVAANGDVANKVGTYLKALAARAHGVPFWVALPSPTFDPELPTGAAIPIERRAAEEVLSIEGCTVGGARQLVRVAPLGVGADNPAFDVTPAALVSAWITERGVFTTAQALRQGLNA